MAALVACFCHQPAAGAVTTCMCAWQPCRNRPMIRAAGMGKWHYGLHIPHITSDAMLSHELMLASLLLCFIQGLCLPTMAMQSCVKLMSHTLQPRCVCRGRAAPLMTVPSLFTSNACHASSRCSRCHLGGAAAATSPSPEADLVNQLHARRLRHVHQLLQIPLETASLCQCGHLNPPTLHHPSPDALNPCAHSP